MRPSDETARTRLRSLEHLRVSELLFAEAELKQGRGERMEAAELRDEAAARRSIGLAMLDETAARHHHLHAKRAASR
jgi:hypothetical protein